MAMAPRYGRILGWTIKGPGRMGWWTGNSWSRTEGEAKIFTDRADTTNLTFTGCEVRSVRQRID